MTDDLDAKVRECECRCPVEGPECLRCTAVACIDAFQARVRELENALAAAVSACDKREEQIDSLQARVRELEAKLEIDLEIQERLKREDFRTGLERAAQYVESVTNEQGLVFGTPCAESIRALEPKE